MDDLAYPAGPEAVPDDITQPSAGYRWRAWLAVLGLLVFVAAYLALLTWFAFVAWTNATAPRADLWEFLLAGCSGLLAVFMLKSLFAVRRTELDGGIEVTPDDHPKLFAFLHRLADDTGAPRPHRVFLTPEVNASVFYNLSALNLLLPSRKNLNIGLGLVNALSLGEFKAVLAHEFGHFAQSSMLVGNWVYIASQIVHHMVSTRDWIDKLLAFVSRIDLRIAWIGWVLSLILWSIRSLMETLLQLVTFAQRALSREMEFNADRVAVSVSGSDAIVHALHRLGAADDAWQQAVGIVHSEAQQGRVLNVFEVQSRVLGEMRRILDDDAYGATPPPGSDPASHRVFGDEFAPPPTMWSTHPANGDREENAKAVYVPAMDDPRPVWVLFDDAPSLQAMHSQMIAANQEAAPVGEGEVADLVQQRFTRPSFDARYKGCFLGRSLVRSVRDASELFDVAEAGDAGAALAALYPDELRDAIERRRQLGMERGVLKAIASGDLKPMGGIIRHRGAEISGREVADAVATVEAELAAVDAELCAHDRHARSAHLAAAARVDAGWREHLESLTRLVHFAEHASARISEQRDFLLNEWMIVTADGNVSNSEVKRMVKAAEAMHAELVRVGEEVGSVTFAGAVAGIVGRERLDEIYPPYEIAPPTRQNIGNWMEHAVQYSAATAGLLANVASAALDELLDTEARVAEAFATGAGLGAAPPPNRVPDSYGTLLPEEERELRLKLSLWDRFVLAQGPFAASLRTLIALGVIGGTLYLSVLQFLDPY